MNRDEHIIFLPCCVNMVNYTGGFLNLKPVFYSQGDTNLKLMYDSFYMLLESAC